MFEKTVKAETVFTGRIVRVELHEVELENGQHSFREIVRHRGAVAVLAQVPDGRFVFIRQFRKPVEKIILEIVAGVPERGEERVDTAKRELKEETGYEAVTIRHLGSIFPTPGYVDERIELFFAETTADAGDRDLDHDERLEVILLRREEFIEKIRQGEIEDSKTLAAWSLYEYRVADRAPAGRGGD